jgi:homopolymeric O-antigen transport system permease protein
MSISISRPGSSWTDLPALLPGPASLLLTAPLKHVELWTGLGWSDIVQSYRRTLLGPFWITLNLAIFTFAITLVYGALFGARTDSYAAYVVCGMIAWMWISALMTDLGNTFVQSAPFLKSTPMDKALFIWASVFKQSIILAHHLIVYVALVLVGVIHLHIYTLLAIPALAVLFLLSIPITATMAILFARYRDLQRLLSSLMILIMMTTPIFWLPSMLTGWRSALVVFNPIHYLVEFVRRPLLGQAPDMTAVSIVLLMTIAVWIAGPLIYKRYEKYVVFWI